MRFLLEYGTVEDLYGNAVQCGDRVLDGNGIFYVVRKIIPPHFFATRENDGALIKLSIEDCMKTRW